MENLELRKENENLRQRIQLLESLKKKQYSIASSLCSYQRTINSTVVSTTSTPTSTTISAVPEDGTTHDDGVIYQPCWETESTEEIIPFELSTKPSNSSFPD